VVGGCQSGKEPPVAAGSMADTADQTMYQARSIITDKGMMRAELLADSAFFFDDNTRIEMRGVHTTFYTTSGEKNAVLTSREGTYRTRSGAMAARGDVVVVSEDGRRLTTQEITFDPATNQIAGDSAFVLTRADQKLEGIGFRSDPNFANFRVLRGTKGDLGIVNLPSEGNAQPRGGVISVPPPPVPESARAATDSARKRPPPGAAKPDTGRP
jgi:LPS export ABC transporter protein LptC